MIGVCLEGVVSFTSRLNCLWFLWIDPLPVVGKGTPASRIKRLCEKQVFLLLFLQCVHSYWYVSE